jgi:hypothetical protein
MISLFIEFGIPESTEAAACTAAISDADIAIVDIIVKKLLRAGWREAQETQPPNTPPLWRWSEGVPKLRQ